MSRKRSRGQARRARDRNFRDKLRNLLKLHGATKHKNRNTYPLNTWEIRKPGFIPHLIRSNAPIELWIEAISMMRRAEGVELHPLEWYMGTLTRVP